MVISQLVVVIYTNLCITIWNWFNDFVIKGNNDSSKEKNGTIKYMDTNFSSTLFTINFNNMGIYKISYINKQKEAIPYFQVEMYVQGISMH